MASEDDESAYARLWQLLWSCCGAPSPLVLWANTDPAEVLIVMCANCGAFH